MSVKNIHMIDFIKRLFGEGYIYTEFTCEDGTKGRTRAPYIGDPDTLDKNEYARDVKEQMQFKHGKRISNIQVTIR